MGRTGLHPAKNGVFLAAGGRNRRPGKEKRPVWGQGAHLLGVSALTILTTLHETWGFARAKALIRGQACLSTVLS